MRILLLNQFFHPDSAATSQLLTDLARELTKQGHQISVICGPSEYASPSNAAPPAATVHRINPLRFGRARWTRVSSYATFLASAALRSIRGHAPDVVLTLTTPPLLSLVGTLVNLFRGARHFIWEMDLYPEIAVDLGVFRRDSLVTKIVGALADFSRRRADGIIALGDDMKARLIARGIHPDKIHVVHNWADSREIRPKPFPGFPITVHYSGNFGLAHDAETIRAAIAVLQCDSRFRFVFTGSGPQRKTLEAFCLASGITSTEFRPYCDRAQLSDSLAEGHIGLVTQNAETIGTVVPSKVYGIMAAGRPILYIGPRATTPARIIERFGCGWHVVPDDVNGLVTLLTRLAACFGEISISGGRARRAFLENFDLPLGTARIAAILAQRDGSSSEKGEAGLIAERHPMARSASAS